MFLSSPYHCRNQDGQDHGMLWIIPCGTTASPVLDGTRSSAPQTLLPARAGKPLPGTRLRAHCGLPWYIPIIAGVSVSSTAIHPSYLSFYPDHPDSDIFFPRQWRHRAWSRRRCHHATSCSLVVNCPYGCRRPSTPCGTAPSATCCHRRHGQTSCGPHLPLRDSLINASAALLAWLSIQEFNSTVAEAKHLLVRPEGLEEAHTGRILILNQIVI